MENNNEIKITLLDELTSKELSEKLREIAFKLQDAEDESERQKLFEEADNIKIRLKKIINENRRKYWKSLNKKFTSETIPELPASLSDKEWFHIYRPALIRCGAISKDQLVVGKTYIGSSRNTSEAIWDGTKFKYNRHKFGLTYSEDVLHFDDAWYLSTDIFIPISIKE